MAENKIKLTAKIYDTIRKPVVSEKSAKLAENGGIAFEVAPKATKKEVAESIFAIYNVRPVKVNMLNAKGKTKTFRGKNKGTQKTIKKAYITLPAGTTLELGK
jgi:large subunit ribosomal protein L23